MQSSAQVSDECQTGHQCLESHMETSALSSARSAGKSPIPLRDAKNHTEHDRCQRESRMETSAQSCDKTLIPLCDAKNHPEHDR